MTSRGLASNRPALGPVKARVLKLLLALVLSASALPTSTSGIDRVRIEGRRSAAGRDPSIPQTRVELPRSPGVFDDLGRALDGSPGLQIQRTGAIGAFTGISIRGTDFRHTRIFIDDLPLAGPESGAFDIGLLPLDAFEAVEVYRSATPTELSSGAIGGAVRLRTRTGGKNEASVSASAGSFGSYGLRGQVSGVGRAWRSTVLGAYATANNDFLVLDDRGTDFDSSDDVEIRRQNADFTQAHGFGQASVEGAWGRLQIAALGLRRAQGEPGPALGSALSARRDRSFGFLTLGWSDTRLVGAAPIHLSASVGAGLQRDELEDPFAEIRAIPEDGTLAFDSGRLRGAARADWLPWLSSTTVVTGQIEDSELENRRAPEVGFEGQRLAFALAQELCLAGRLLGTRAELIASLRWEHLSSEQKSAQFEGERDEDLITGRVGLSLGGPRLRFSSQLAQGARAPTLRELFGDGRFLVENPGLRPEQGLTLDGGFSARLEGPVMVQFEARGYHIWIEDLIRLRSTANGQAFRAENVEQARITGAELGLQGRWASWLELGGSLSLGLARRPGTAEEDAARIAFRPVLLGTLDLGVHSGPVGAWLQDGVLRARLRHRSSFLQADGDAPAPPRIGARSLVDLGAQLDFDRGWSVSARVLDLANDGGKRRAAETGGSDFLGFPLPGRRFEIAALWRGPW